MHEVISYTHKKCKLNPKVKGRKNDSHKLERKEKDAETSCKKKRTEKGTIKVWEKMR